MQAMKTPATAKLYKSLPYSNISIALDSTIIVKVIEAVESSGSPETLTLAFITSTISGDSESSDSSETLAEDDITLDKKYYSKLK
jgi:hypothetical protein